MNEEQDHTQSKSKRKKSKKKRHHEDKGSRNGEEVDETTVNNTNGDSLASKNHQEGNSPVSGNANGDSVDSDDRHEATLRVSDTNGIHTVNDDAEHVTNGENVPNGETKPKENGLSNSRLDEVCSQVKQNIAKGDFLEKLEKTLQQDGREEEAASACRRMFREEMVRLRTEVEEFKDLCIQQVEIQKQLVEKHRRSCEKDLISLAPRNGLKKNEEVDPQLQEQLKQLESSMEFFQHKQKILDEEMDLLNREETLARKQKDLEQYEKEIIEVEAMLNQRQAISTRRQRHLATLDEELQSLRSELEETKEQINQDQTTEAAISERAQRNCYSRSAADDWDLLRRNLIDRQHLLEGTVQKYRSELASASSAVAGKEIIITKMSKQLSEKDDLLETKERKMKQLESKLAIALSETRMMEDHLQKVLQENSDCVVDNTRTSPSPRSSHESGHSRGHFAPDGYHGSRRSSSVFSKRKSVDLSASMPPGHFKSPLKKGYSGFTLLSAGRDNGHKPLNGTLSPETNSHKPETLNSLIIRRRSTRANSVYGDVSKLTLRTPRDNDNEDFNKSGACAIM